MLKRRRTSLRTQKECRAFRRDTPNQARSPPLTPVRLAHMQDFYHDNERLRHSGGLHRSTHTIRMQYSIPIPVIDGHPSLEQISA